MTVYVLTINDDVWGVYSTMAKATAVVLDKFLEDGTWYIATREIE